MMTRIASPESTVNGTVCATVELSCAAAGHRKDRENSPSDSILENHPSNVLLEHPTKRFTIHNAGMTPNPMIRRVY
jgi:hypothetical protein